MRPLEQPQNEKEKDMTPGQLLGSLVVEMSRISGQPATVTRPIVERLFESAGVDDQAQSAKCREFKKALKDIAFICDKKRRSGMTLVIERIACEAIGLPVPERHLKPPPSNPIREAKPKKDYVLKRI